MRMYRAETMTELSDKMTRKIVLAPKEKLDVISSVDVQIHNTISEAESMEYEFDLKSLWLTPSRWTMMARQYIDPDELRAWIEVITGKIGLRKRGIAMMRTRVVKPRGGPEKGNKETRRWGSCMMAISYKARPAPQITLYSRTSYLGYLGGMDLGIAWMCGNYLAKAMNCDVADFKFVWMNEALQYHNFKSLAYLLNHPDEDERDQYRHLLMDPLKRKERESLSPALELSRNWMAHMLKLDETGQHLGDMNYNTYRRIRRRFHTEVFGYEHAQQFEGWSYHKKGPKKGEKKEFFKAYTPLPHTMLSDLDFGRAIGMNIHGKYAVEFDENAELEDEDDE